MSKLGAQNQDFGIILRERLQRKSRNKRWQKVWSEELQRKAGLKVKKCRKFVLLKIEIKQQIASFLAITDYS